MSYETEVHGEIEVVTGPCRINIVDEEDWEEPSLRLVVGDKTAITEDDEGHISLRLGIEDGDGNVGTARASFDPDGARELGEALVEEADSETEPLFGEDFMSLEREDDEADKLVEDLEE